MSMLAATIPLITFVILISLFEASEFFREKFLKATLIWGVLVVFNTEILSRGSVLKCSTLVSLWIAEGGLCFVLVAFRMRRCWLKNIDFTRPWVFLLATPLFLTVLAACFSAPNNWDSMTYHMSRVEHWLQQESVKHFATAISRQIFLNPWAEFAILQFQILTFDSDRLANLVQWFAFGGSAVGVSLIIKELRGNAYVQALGALIVMTTPSVILESTSTQNDLVCAFFVTCVAYFSLRVLTELTVSNLFFLSLATALAVLTKGTAYFFAAPFLFWVGVSLLGRRDFLSLAKLIALGFIVVFGVNFWHWQRNFMVWHNPLGDSAVLAVVSNQAHGLSALASNILRSSALHSPGSGRVNMLLTGALTWFHTHILHLDINAISTSLGDGPFNVRGFSDHEDLAGNPVQFILFAASLLFCCRRKMNDPQLRRFILATFGGFVLFCWMLKWQSTGSRLQTPFFILSAVSIGFLLNSLFKEAKAVPVLLLLSAIPWLFSNVSRPLIYFRHGVESVFSTSREDTYFANRTDVIPEYKAITEEIYRFTHDSQCKVLGLKTSEDSWEYPLRRLLIARGVNLPLLHVDVSELAQRRLESEAKVAPCAIITIDQNQWRPSAAGGVVFARAWQGKTMSLFTATPD